MPPKPKTADPPPPPEEEEAASPPVMEKDVHIVVQVIVRKCEPLPEEAPRRKKTAGSGEEEGEEGDGEEDGESKEAATGPKPTLEELGVKFVLNTFNGNTSERSPAARPISPLCLLSASAPLPGCCQATGAC